MAGLVVVTARSAIAQEAGFVVSMTGEWIAGPAPGKVLRVGQVVSGGSLIQARRAGESAAHIEIALYAERRLLSVSCGPVVDCAPVEIPKPEPSSSPVQRILKVVQGVFLEHPQAFEYAISRSARLELQSAVITDRRGHVVARPPLTPTGRDLSTTFRLRPIDAAGNLGRVDARLSIFVRRVGEVEELRLLGDPTPGLYNVGDQGDADERPEHAPAVPGAWVLIAPTDRGAALQEQFGHAAEGIRWPKEAAAARASILRAYLLYLQRTEV